MSKVIELETQTERQNWSRNKKTRAIRIDLIHGPFRAEWSYSAVTLGILAIWITSSIANDFLLFKEVVASSFIILCLLLFKCSEQDQSRRDPIMNSNRIKFYSNVKSYSDAIT